MKVGVSLLAADYSALGEQIKKLEKAGVDFFSFDIMDGHFVPNLTVGPATIKSCRNATTLPIECHLMIENPEKFLQEFLDAGCDIITVHLESTNKMKDLINAVKSYGRKVSIAIKPETPTTAVIPFLDSVDMILVMTVDPGFAGQPFIDESEKIKALKSEIERRKLNVEIMIDGGVNNETAKIVKKAGADMLVSASYILKNDYKTAIENLRNA